MLVFLLISLTPHRDTEEFPFFPLKEEEKYTAAITVNLQRLFSYYYNTLCTGRVKWGGVCSTTCSKRKGKIKRFLPSFHFIARITVTTAHDEDRWEGGKVSLSLSLSPSLSLSLSLSYFFAEWKTRHGNLRVEEEEDM